MEGTCPTGAHGLGAFRPFLTGGALRLMSNGDGDGDGLFGLWPIAELDASTVSAAFASTSGS